MIRKMKRRIVVWILVGGLALTLSACSPKTQSGPTPEERTTQQALLNQKLSALQVQAAKLDKQFADLRLDQQQRMQALMIETQALTNQIALLKSDLGVGPARKAGRPQVAPFAPLPAEPKALAPARAPAGNTSGGRFWLRLLLVIIIIVAILVIVKVFMGRWGEEEEDDDEELTGDSGDEEIVTEEGTIRVAPEAQAHPSATAAESPQPRGEQPDAERKS